MGRSIASYIEKKNLGIKHVIFDLGGVVFEYKDGLLKMAKLFSQSSEEIIRRFKEHDDAMCKGELDPQTFFENLGSRYGVNVKGTSFLDLWVSGFESIEGTREEIISLKKSGFRVGVLTNIFPSVFERIRKIGLLPDVLLSPVVKSCDVKLVKPQKEIFEYTQKLLNCSPEEVLYIDDNSKNVIAARDVGWNSLLFSNGEIVDYEKS